MTDNPPLAQSIAMDLSPYFARLNQKHFDGFLEEPLLRWNSRIRSSAGRFIPGNRRWLRERPPIIEVASYLLKEVDSLIHIEDTLGHEMIHYWLWVRGKSYGHTAEFLSKMKSMGVSRYNPIPKSRPYRHVYQCANCLKNFPAKRKLGILACAACCKQFSNGKFDHRFKLAYIGLASMMAIAACTSHSESSETIWITRPDGALSCEVESGQSLEKGALDLQKRGIKILSSKKASDQKMHIQVCGAPQGSSNAYEIPRAQLEEAASIGFTESSHPTPTSR